MSNCNHEKMDEHLIVCACNRYFVVNIVHLNLREIKYPQPLKDTRVDLP